MTRVLVVYNDSSSSETFQTKWNGAAFTYTLPALAAATFQWTAPPAVVGCWGRDPGQTASFHFTIPAECPLYTVPATAQIQASSYNNVSNLETETTADTGGGFDVGYASDGSWAQYRDIDFGTGVSTLSARVASGGSGGTLEFHLRSPFGPIIATATVPVTGGWQNWTTVSAPVSRVQGLNSIYVVYRATAGPNGIANLNWFQFQ
jgi:glucosylceramidase